jgi:hypothetical protein
MPLIKTFWAIGLAVVLAPVSAYADDYAPLPMTNQSPLVQIHGLPALGSPRLLRPDQLEVSVGSEAANYFYANTTPVESLLLDGETHRTALTVRYGTRGAEWGVEVPYLSHSGGSMDSFIENWHETFGMRNGGRHEVPRHQLGYIYQRNGIELLRLTRTARGVGDMRVYGARPLLRDEGDVDVALRTSLKLPTGESSELLGSGAYDLALWLSAGCSQTACPGTVRWTAGGGVLWLGQGDVLPQLQRKLVSFGGIGMGWRALETVVLKTDLRLHSRFYDGSELEPLHATTVQLLLGALWNITARTTLEVGLSEDLKVYSAPDVSLMINLRSNF